MTLDQRIAKDLKELYNGRNLNGVISSANDLNNAHIVNEPFSTQGLPRHFTGDRNSKTVIVMLNPKLNTKKQNNIHTTLSELNIKTSSLNSFISSYKDSNKDFGKLSKGSAFDVKQARFIAPWDKSGIVFPLQFPSDRKTYPKAKEAVLLNKLQLELIPYSSNKFEIDRNKIKTVIPYVDTLFCEIFSQKRQYIIFCGNVFEDIFDIYNSQGGRTSIKNILQKTCPITISKTGKQINFHCHVIEINYNGNTYIAIIANSFAHRRLIGDAMSVYGKFCYDTYISTPITTIGKNN